MKRSRRDIVVVTPEHVTIRLHPAGLGSRFLAVIADFILVLGIAAIIRKVIQAVLPNGVGLAIFVTINFVLTWGYHLYFETRRNGRSPGKKMNGLRVVDARGLPISLQQSMVRNIVRLLDMAPFFYGVGTLAALIDPHGRRLGDLAADTLVIREEQPMARETGLAATRHFNTLRTGKMLALVRNRIGLEEREFLLALCLRAHKLDPAARYDLMEEVAARYRAKLGIDDPHLSGENLVRDLTSLLFSDEARTRLASKR